jgi:hypothetical protein
VPAVRVEQTGRTDSAFKRRSRRALACGVSRITRSVRHSRHRIARLIANVVSMLSPQSGITNLAAFGIVLSKPVAVAAF